MKTYLDRATNLSLFWPLFHSRSQLLAPAKNRRFLRFIHILIIIFIIIIIIIINNFFIWVFSEYTEAVTTSLLPIDAILPEICTFIVGFSCTVWTKMRSLGAN